MTSPDAQARLMACERCGGSDQVLNGCQLENGQSWCVQCSCGHRSPFKGGSEEAIAAWNTRTPDAQPSSESDEITDDQIKHMVDRFLSWKLPENFNPDNGISFKPTFNDHLPEPMKHNPVGTNLLDAMQAEAMVRHMIAGLSQPSSTEGEVERALKRMVYEATHLSPVEDDGSHWCKISADALADARAAIAAQVTKP